MNVRYRHSGGATLLVLLLAAGASGQQPAAAGAYAVPGHGSLKLAVPEGWRAASTPLQEPPSLTLRIGASGSGLQLLVTAVWLDAAKSAGATPEQLKADLLRGAEGPLKQAVEKAATVQELRGAASSGYYFSLTDRAPPPGEFKYLTQGMSRTGELLVTFTMLHHDMPSPDRERALKMIADATHVR